jgi:predicted lipid carrier protein YhbT
MLFEGNKLQSHKEEKFMSKLQLSPILPSFLARPLTWLPPIFHNQALALSLNQALKKSLQNNELDFLEGKVLRIGVLDAEMVYSVSLNNRKFIAEDNKSLSDIQFEGTLYDFLLLITRREDPDTLFFNRRLKLGGNTELGLELKNFLDALEPEQEFNFLFNGLNQFISNIDRFYILKQRFFL